MIWTGGAVAASKCRSGGCFGEEARPHLAAPRRERFRDGEAIAVPVTVARGERERPMPRKARRRDELPSQTR